MLQIWHSKNACVPWQLVRTGALSQQLRVVEVAMPGSAIVAERAQITRLLFTRLIISSLLSPFSPVCLPPFFLSLFVFPSPSYAASSANLLLGAARILS